MFWIYGGGFDFGMGKEFSCQNDINSDFTANAGQPAYDGSSFATYQDVIIVAPNYRTNGKY